MRVLFLCGLICFGAASTRAQPFIGTVGGTVTSADPRDDPYVAAGYPAAIDGNNGGAARLTNRFDGTTVPVSNVLVQVCVSLAYAPCLKLWTRTNGAGQYTVPWSGFAPPTSIRVKVYAQQPNIGVGAVVASAWPPAATFRVTTSGVTDVVIGDRNVTTSLTGNRTVNVSVVNEEATAAFITTREVYSVLGAQTIPPGGSIVSDMQGLDVFVNEIGSGWFAEGGIAPSAAEVLLSPGTAQVNPFTLAHEVGHIVAWRSLDIGLPPYEFSAYSACELDAGAGWSNFSNECEKPAFWEGFAHVVAGFWMWIPTIQPTALGFCARSGHGIPRNGCTSLESPIHNPTSTLGGVAACGTGSGAHRRAICNARGLWDIVDRPNGLERDLGEVVRVLRAYPRVCLPAPFDNRCVNEFGYDGMNWKDYKANHITQFPDDEVGFSVAETSNNLQGSVND